MNLISFRQFGPIDLNYSSCNLNFPKLVLYVNKYECRYYIYIDYLDRVILELLFSIKIIYSFHLKHIFQQI